MVYASYPYFYLMLLLRYSIIAGITFLIFYILFKRKFQVKRIQKYFPKNKDYAREILFSFITLIIFALYAFSLRSPFIREHGNIYINFNEHSLLYFIISIILTIVIHDTYFLLDAQVYASPQNFQIIPPYPPSFHQSKPLGSLRF